MCKKILIIDDDHSLLRLSQMILNRKGYNVEIASSSKNAKELLGSKNSVNLIILDLMMPDEDGNDFLDWINDPENVHKTTPIILNTAKTLTESEISTFLTRCKTIIPKGMNFTENLITEVTNVLPLTT